MDPKQIVHSDPEILGGTPVFVGTRVPIDALIDFLEGGDTIEEFLENYPGVSREQVFAAARIRDWRGRDRSAEAQARDPASRD